MWSFVSSTFIVFTVIYDVLTPIHGMMITVIIFMLVLYIYVALRETPMLSI